MQVSDQHTMSDTLHFSCNKHFVGQKIKGIVAEDGMGNLVVKRPGMRSIEAYELRVRRDEMSRQPQFREYEISAYRLRAEFTQIMTDAAGNLESDFVGSTG